MRKIFNLMVAVMLAAIAAGCSVRDLADIEPTGWEKQQFEREVRQSVAKAVNTPGIDNGSTIVVTNAGDTLIARPTPHSRHPAFAQSISTSSPRHTPKKFRRAPSKFQASSWS